MAPTRTAFGLVKYEYPPATCAADTSWAKAGTLTARTPNSIERVFKDMFNDNHRNGLTCWCFFGAITRSASRNFRSASGRIDRDDQSARRQYSYRRVAIRPR